MAAFDVLREFFKARGTFTDAELALAESLFVPRTLHSGDFLQRAGDVSLFVAFVAKGLLRSYSIDDKGNEHIVQFAAETYWLGDSASLTTGAPSQFFIQALEDSDLLLLDRPGHEKGMSVPGYAEGFRIGILRHAAAKDRRIVAVLSASAEERYLEFLQTYPSIVTRVPQFMLASYLGISPETLSRIRKNLSRRKPRRGAVGQPPGDENQSR
jgi:CRP-like cAMP-binding protein